jgi:hypothetical protein
MVQRVQRGPVFPVKNSDGKVVSFHVRYRVVEMRDRKPVRVLKSHKLVNRDNKYFSATCKAVQDKCDDFMRRINPAKNADQPIVTFWEQTYLPFVEENKKASTVGGYRQIWDQHLKNHLPAGRCKITERTWVSVHADIDESSGAAHVESHPLSRFWNIQPCR